MHTELGLAVVTTLVVACCGGRVDDGASNMAGTAAGGYTAAGEDSLTGGRTATGGATATGGRTTTGGATATGGATIVVGAVGADCGSLESIVEVNGHNLRVAELITIAASSGSPTYQIDTTEVTRGQYEDWVKTDPPLPSSGDADCGWKSAGSFAPDPSCMASSSVCQGADCENHPVVCVDWCAAYYYCAAVGKRLCGRIDGGEGGYVWGDRSEYQWTFACSSGGANTYPYGNTYDASCCNGYDYWDWHQRSESRLTLPVATLSTCKTPGSGSCGAYDMSGNVNEWEDSCYDTSAGQPVCHVLGGAFDSYTISGVYGGLSTDDTLVCSEYGAAERDSVYDSVGFRCCSP